MKPSLCFFWPLILVLLGGCTSSKRSPKHAPVSEVNIQIIEAAILAQAAAAKPAVASVQPPDSIVLPGVYRPVLSDGRMTLRHETNPKLIRGNYAVVMTDPGRGEISHQPGLMEEELAREVVGLKIAQAQNLIIAQNMVQETQQVSQQAALLNQQIDGARADLAATREANVLMQEELNRLRSATPPPTAPENSKRR